MRSTQPILILSPDKLVSDILQFELNRNNYSALVIQNIETLALILKRNHPRLILLDMSFPEDILIQIFSLTNAVSRPIPLILLASKGTETTMAKQSTSMSVETINKPFSMDELKIQLHIILRRSSAWSISGLTFPEREKSSDGDIKIDTEQFRVYKNNIPIDLSEREYELLLFLASNPGVVYSRETLMQEVWEYGSVGEDTRVVDVGVRRLRKKIEDNPSKPQIILTKRGKGYYFSEGNSRLTANENGAAKREEN